MSRKAKSGVAKFPSELFFQTYQLENAQGAYTSDLEACLDASKLEEGDYIVYRPVRIVRVERTTKVEVLEVVE